MGSTLRVASMTCTATGKAENQKFSYVVAITDVVTSRTVPLLTEEEAVEPLVALRSCPHGRYLAVMPRAGGLQVCRPPCCLARMMRPAPGHVPPRHRVACLCP